MRFQIQKLSLTNFKGIRSFTISFELVTNIFGRNEAGKTTLMDAFLWLLFGKDSTDRKTFEIKTLDENNQPYHRLEHEVCGQFLVNDYEQLTLRKVFREKWVSKRGEKEKVFSGHETEYYWNDVPLKESEYQAKIAGLIDEKLFKLITNTAYFNQVLSWQDRRGVLLQIAGAIEDSEVLATITTSANKEQVAELTRALNQKKSISEFKAEINAKKRKIAAELELIPSRIDEANRSLPEDLNYKEIEILLNQAHAELETTESLLMNKSQAQREHQKMVSEKIKEVQDLTTKLQQIEFGEKNAVVEKRRGREQHIADRKNELRIKQQELSRLLNDHELEKKRHAELSTWAANLRKDWETVNSETLEFKEGEFICPACKRDYEASDIEAKKQELTVNFNISKSQRLASITERGKKISDDIKVLEAKLHTITEQGKVVRDEVSRLENDIRTLEEENISRSQNEEAEVKAAIRDNTEYQGIKEMIALRTEQINTPYKEDNAELLSRKSEITREMDELKKKLASRDQRTRILERIEELKSQESTMAQELASLQGIEFCIEQFDKARMDILEGRINGRFETVRFKMFRQQINGGMEPCCETLIKGVPYTDANTAAKVQAGLEIVNVLSEHYGIYGPVWIDNRESVTKLPETKSQLINLFVSPRHEKLTVGELEEEMAMA